MKNIILFLSQSNKKQNLCNRLLFITIKLDANDIIFAYIDTSNDN